ncbi:putative F-box/FBD/LRR-repeat protein At4g13965 [Durio zibethinus]|uniref:F-box/FBD/LRR-repeat protein At4g13965 n=1 Tax=Durio zibethinus TaxID=66656 RepID=A0A6P6AXG2_DURZI|nr:putative F-box/FBD/LRR-repeat protein At4g13965 [Durio zibethinus]
MATMKKSRASKENEMDRLSDLPDSLIHHILSSLNTKNAVQTCVLSKRWSHLWTCLPSLNFDSQSFKYLTSFKKFVLHVLSRREPSNLHSLKFHSCSSDKTFIGRVICYAVSHSVQEIYMDRTIHPAYRLLSSTSLRTLHLENCSLFGDHFSRCLNLENLFIDRCFISVEHKVIKISGPRLVAVNISRVTQIGYESETYAYTLVVSSPRLSSFCYQGSCPSALSMEGCSILDRVNIGLSVHEEKQEFRTFLKNTLQGVILHAKLLTIEWKEGLMIKTALRNNDVHAIIYNEATKEERNLCWKAANENFELFFEWIFAKMEIKSSPNNINADFWRYSAVFHMAAQV